MTNCIKNANTSIELPFLKTGISCLSKLIFWRYLFKLFFSLNLLVFISSNSIYGQCPFVYFQFEGNGASSSPATNSTPVSSPNFAGSSGLVGDYSHNPLGASQPNCATAITVNSLNGFTIEFIARFDHDFAAQRAGKIFLFGNSYATFEYPSITFTTSTYLGGTNFYADEFTVSFEGVGRKSWDYYMDNNWHHMAFVFDATSGDKAIWIDGQLPDGFSKTVTSTGSVGGDNTLYLVGSGDVQFTGDIDEVALYDVAISGEKICYNYNELITGNHLGTASVGCLNVCATIPTADDVTGSLDPNDFPIGYNSSSPLDYSWVNYQQGQLFSFPFPRFKPGHSFRTNLNWLQPHYLGGDQFPQSPPNDPVPLSTILQAELVKNWNYSVLVSDNTANYAGSYNAAWIDYANLYPKIQRSVISFRAQTIPADAGYPETNPCIADPTLSTDHFLNDGMGNFLHLDCIAYAPPTDKYWSPAATLTDYDHDGLTQKFYLDNILTSLVPRRLDYIAENDEVTALYPGPQDPSGPCILTSDPAVVSDKPGALSWPEYQGTRKMELDNRYRDAFMGMDPSYQPVLSGLENAMFLNYAVDGHPDWRVNYTQLRNTQKPIDNNLYPTPDIYPERPFYWRTFAGAIHGWQWMMETRNIEIESPFFDLRFAP
jgi:hypothetical protein